MTLWYTKPPSLQRIKSFYNCHFAILPNRIITRSSTNKILEAQKQTHSVEHYLQNNHLTGCHLHLKFFCKNYFWIGHITIDCNFFFLLWRRFSCRPVRRDFSCNVLVHISLKDCKYPQGKQTTLYPNSCWWKQNVTQDIYTEASLQALTNSFFSPCPWG